MFVHAETLETVWGSLQKSHCRTKPLNKITETVCDTNCTDISEVRKGGLAISRHDSHFLLLLDLLLFLLVVLHYLQPLSLDQAALLDVELFFCLQEETEFTQQTSFLWSSISSSLHCCYADHPEGVTILKAHFKGLICDLNWIFHKI